MKYLITGGAGFIGSTLANYLVKLGEDVRIIDNLSSGKLTNLSSILDQIEFIEGDIRDRQQLSDSLKSVDIIFHLAAQTSVVKSVKFPMETIQINAGGTLNLLEISRQSNIKKIIYMSSCAVYGNTDEKYVTEHDTPDPLSPYASSKLVGELYCNAFSNLYNMEILVVRPFNIYGPAQDASSGYAAVIPSFINSVITGTPISIYGDGNQTRDFIFVNDVCKILHKLSNKVKLYKQVVNIATGISISINKLKDIIMKFDSSDIKVNYLPSRKGEARFSFSDNKLLLEELGEFSFTDIQDGLKDTYEWFYKESGIK